MNTDSTQRRLTYTYVLALAFIGLLSIGAYIHLHQIIDSQRRTREQIALSGDQRMLSQRIAFYVVELIDAEAPLAQHAARESLRTTIQQMEHGHTALIKDRTFAEQPISTSATANLDTQIRSYLAHAMAILAAPDAGLSRTHPDVQALLVGESGSVLAALDRAVAASAQESEAEIVGLHTLSILLLIAILTTLILEGLLLFAPMVRSVVREQQHVLATQQHLTTVLNHAPVILFACDESGIITLSTGRGLASLGQTPHAQEGQSALEKYQHEPDVIHNVQRALAGETFQVQTALADNVFETAYTPLHDSQNKLRGFIGVATNITERTRSEAALRASEARAHQLAEAAAESETTIRTLYTIASAHHIDFDARVTALLDMGCQRFQLPIGMLSRIEDNRFYVLAADTPDGSIQAGNVFALENTYCNITVQANEPIGILHAGLSSWSNHPCYAACMLESYFGAPVLVRGNVYGTLCFSSAVPRANDFTDADKDLLRLMAQWVSGAIEQRLAAAELEEQYRTADKARSESRAVLDSTSEGIVLVAPDGIVLTVNKRFIDLFMITAEQIIGQQFQAFEQDFQHIFVNADTFLAHIDRAIQRDDAQSTDILVQRYPVQRELTVFSTAIWMGQGEYRGQLYVFRDVTHERAVDRMKSEFISLVSHELRTPLTSIKGYVDILLDGDVGPLPQEQAEFLTIIKNNADRQCALITDLLDVASIESGRLALRYTWVRLNDVIQNVVTLLYPQITAKRQSVTLELDTQLPLIRGDADRVFQIITNLLSNAHKYTPANGQIHIRATGGGTIVRVYVQDNGIGLSTDEQLHLFSRFYRARNRTTQEVGGTGLGLSITRALVELHGGTIEVTSSTGAGALFSIMLPINQPAVRVEPFV